jgi:hypothetical protein
VNGRGLYLFSSKCASGAHETISERDEKVLKQRRPMIPLNQKRGLVMLAIILNAIYRQFITATLPGIRLGTRR